MLTDDQFIDKLVQLFNESNDKAKATQPLPYFAVREFGPDYGTPTNQDDFTDAAGYMLPTHPEYIADEHIINAIDQILIRSLTEPTKISEASARTMEILHGIKMDILNFEADLAEQDAN